MIKESKFSLCSIIFWSTNHKYLRSIRTNTHWINSTIKITNLFDITIFSTLNCTITKSNILCNKEINLRHLIIHSSNSRRRVLYSIKQSITKNILSITISIFRVTINNKTSRSLSKHTRSNNYSVLIFKTKENRIIRILIFCTFFCTLNKIFPKCFKTGSRIFWTFSKNHIKETSYKTVFNNIRSSISFSISSIHTSTRFVISANSISKSNNRLIYNRSKFIKRNIKFFFFRILRIIFRRKTLFFSY